MNTITDLEPTASEHVQEKWRRRRAEILRAALRAFREKGYAETTLGDIAEYVGVRKTALYHYFPDKESILYECHKESLSEVSGLLQAARTTYEGAADRLRYVVREHVRVMTESLDGSPISFEVPSLSGERQREIIAARDRYEGGLRQIVKQGIDDGEFQKVDPKLAVFAILGAINWISRWYRPGGPAGTADMGKQFADHLVGGLLNGNT